MTWWELGNSGNLQMYNLKYQAKIQVSSDLRQ
jgi:hypothetical protein